MRPLVRSYGVISTSTLSPASTRMRFLRMRPAVCAMISCSFSSLTRKVAFGSSSVTTPGNSNSSSFAIRCPDCCPQAGSVANPAEIWRGHYRMTRFITTPLKTSRRTTPSLFIARPARDKPLADARQNLIADIAIGLEPLLAAAFDRFRIGGRPIFHVDGAGAGQFQGAVMGLGRERDDEIEIEPFPFIQLLECQRLVLRNIEADFRHHRDRKRVELAFAHAGRADIDAAPEDLSEQGGRD